MKSRRQFLNAALFSLPTVNIIKKLARWQIPLEDQAVVLSTWDSGLEVNKVAYDQIKFNEKAIDAVEKAGIYIENQISCCVGLGGNPDRDGNVTLDACIMDHDFNCGSVAFLQRIKNPVSVARKVMENTPHVMLVGKGAQKFAISQGFILEKNELHAEAEKNYKNWLKESKYDPLINIENKVPETLKNGKHNHDTMGTICLDNDGKLAGMCTTSGMAFKMNGRVGDSPLIGAGLYVDGKIGAATASGQGEEVIRSCGTFSVVEFMQQGNSPEIACRKVIEKIVSINPEKAKKFQVGFIALNVNGEYGAFSVHPGFSYAVTFKSGKSIVLESNSYFI
ncbi:MAG: N(4)-(beta-N-acetylglucosaminyl)-L-asparaginase [Saprospiraceae bacterium]